MPQEDFVPCPLFEEGEAPNLDFSIDPRDYKEAAYWLRQMATYCDWKAAALQLREEGQIEEALDTEQNDLEPLYNKLPKAYRW